MRIRPFTPADHAAVVSLHEELQSCERTLRPSRAVGRAVSERQVEMYVSMLADADEDAHLLVADSGDRPVGFVFFEIEMEFLEREARQIYIHDIVVTGAARRRGVGGMLMAAVRSVMAEKGVRPIELQVLVGNDHALEFYRRHGFEIAYFGLKAIT